MPRSGVEEKLPWRDVPLAVRQRVAEAMGASVARGERVWGGYGPTPTYRLRLVDGRHAFLKATNRASNGFMVRALVAEERVYGALSHIIGAWMPRFFASFHHNDWHVMLLEDLGRQTIPPWTPTLARQVIQAYADFHASTLGADLPELPSRPQDSLPRVTWSRVTAESDNMHAIATLAGDQSGEAYAWLRPALPVVTDLADAASNVPGPYALLHNDTRSDNLRYTRGRLILFDWPFAGVGRPEFDLVAFAQSISLEGGPSPEQLIAWYGERLPVDAHTLDVALAWLAAFFADQAWRPDVPGLPRLRPFQRAQLAVVLPWLARRVALPPPTWADTLR